MWLFQFWPLGGSVYGFLKNSKSTVPSQKRSEEENSRQGYLWLPTLPRKPKSSKLQISKLLSRKPFQAARNQSGFPSAQLCKCFLFEADQWRFLMLRAATHSCINARSFCELKLLISEWTLEKTSWCPETFSFFLRSGDRSVTHVDIFS